MIGAGYLIDILCRCEAVEWRINMPYVNMMTNVSVSKEKEQTLVDVLGKGIEVISGKVKENLFIRIEDDCALYKAGSTSEPNAMVSVDLFGYSSNEDLKKYTEIIQAVLDKELSIKADKIFINFTECRHWGSGSGCSTAFEV